MTDHNKGTEDVAQDLLGSGPRSFRELREHVARARKQISESHGLIERTDILRVQAYQHEVIGLLSWALSRAIAIGASRE